MRIKIMHPQEETFIFIVFEPGRSPAGYFFCFSLHKSQIALKITATIVIIVKLKTFIQAKSRIKRKGADKGGRHIASGF